MHPDSTKVNAPIADEELQYNENITTSDTLKILEKELYKITKETKQSIDDSNTLFLEFLRAELAKLWYKITDNTDRSILINKNNKSYLLWAKSSNKTVQESYIGLIAYCAEQDLAGGLLYYSDKDQRLKLISYTTTWWNKKSPDSLSWSEVRASSNAQGSTFVNNSLTDSKWQITTKLPGKRNIDRLYPIYSEILGISSSWIARNMWKAINVIPHYFKEYLPTEFIKKFWLLWVQETIRQSHFPDSEQALALAQQRIYFDRLLRIQLHSLLERESYMSSTSAASVSPTDFWSESWSQFIQYDLIKEFTSKLSFELTNAQKKVIKEMLEDIVSKWPHNNQKMMRLLQWDVWSGKTVVVAAIAYYIIKVYKQQVAFLAPLSILAEQHYQSLAKLFLPLGVRIELIQWSKTKTTKDKLKTQFKSWQIDLIVGTQALIQEDVEFYNLWLAIIDEQHKFWVNQRAFFHHHGSPHIIQMSATPIPRSLALAFFGEFDVSVIDEMPAGRRSITTKIIDQKERKKLAPWLKHKINEGQKIFVVAPLIEESDTLELANVEEIYQETQDLLPEYQSKIWFIHGRIKAKEKEQIMADFKSGKYRVLVATTVIEVGVDIPEATVMMIYNAERFWLSQLHQLRGRIGRNDLPSYCFLQTANKSSDSYTRLQAMERTSDGFELAQIDLQYRGAGEILGTKQAGQTDLPMEIMTDISFIEKVKSGALRLLDHYPWLDWLPGLQKFVGDEIQDILA